MSYNVKGMRRFPPLTERWEMWRSFCVGTSEATDLAKTEPGGGAKSPPERIPCVIRRFGL
jgi:hypothetical protein